MRREVNVEVEFAGNIFSGIRMSDGQLEWINIRENGTVTKRIAIVCGDLQIVKVESEPI